MSCDFQLLYYTFNMSNMLASDQFLLILSLYVHSLIFNYFTGSNSSMFWATSYLLFCLSVYSHLLHFAPIVSDSSNFRQAQQTKFVVSKIKQFTARILILFRLGGGGGMAKMLSIKCHPTHWIPYWCLQPALSRSNIYYKSSLHRTQKITRVQLASSIKSWIAYFYC